MTETLDPRVEARPAADVAAATKLGKTENEDEAGHLRRVAQELGGANSPLVHRLAATLADGDRASRMAAAARLGAMGERHATAELRKWLESDDTSMWEVAAHGLRQSRDRSGWLCLESVALDHVESLADDACGPPPHAFRLLVMGRTKTMDRLFRAMDGHSRSIPALAAINFAKAAVRSVPPGMSRALSMRLGLSGQPPATPEAVALACGVSAEMARQLESRAWETVQTPRPYAEIMQRYGENSE